MALRTLVKVGEINNLSDARYCAGMGTDLLGFNLDEEHPKRIEIQDYQAITAWLEGVKFVGEFENSNAEIIQELYKQLKFDFIEVKDAELLASLKDIPCKKIYRYFLKDNLNSVNDLFKEVSATASFILLESDNEQNLEKEDMVILSQLCEQYQIILGYGFNAANVEEVIESIDVGGIALKGGEEERPGYKDFEDLADILELLEIDY